MESPSKLIGRRITIVGKHPHKGFSGIVKDYKSTIMGKYGFVVKLDNGLSCFVFSRDNLKEEPHAS